VPNYQLNQILVFEQVNKKNLAKKMYRYNLALDRTDKKSKYLKKVFRHEESATNVHGAQP
jgi:hypothetical protein